jgi:hypothetical protein
LAFITAMCSAMSLGCDESGSDAASMPSNAGTGAGSAGTLAAGAGTGGAQGGRGASSSSCDDYLRVITGGDVLDNQYEVLMDEWGAMPTDLQRLPPGAELCGAYYLKAEDGSVDDASGSLGFVAFRSSLDPAALQAFYEPLLTTVGCTTTGEPVSELLVYFWTCPAEQGLSISFTPSDPDFGAYQITYMIP